MFFRNLMIFRFPVGLNIADLDRQLAELELKPVGTLELSSAGWVSPGGTDGEGRFAFHHVDFHETEAIWLAMGTEEKLLPGPVVDAALKRRLREIEEKEGRKPGGRARKRLKEEIVHDLLPKAFVRPGRVDGYLDLRHGLCIVDTASRKVGENFVSLLRHTLGSFPALPLNAEVAPRSVLTGWIAGEPLPDGLVIGDEAILEDAADGGAIARLQRQELQGDETEQHLAAGKQVTRLGLSMDDHVSFTLDEDLTVRKFKLLDGAADSLANVERDDLQAELDARFALQVAEVRRLFGVLEPALKISKVED